MKCVICLGVVGNIGCTVARIHTEGYDVGAEYVLFMQEITVEKKCC